MNLLVIFGLMCLQCSEILTRLSIKDIPEENMNVPEMIRYHGYPCETHNITTQDGYILTLHRIPHGREKGEGGGFPTFLQHGFVDSSATWTMNPPSQSLAFILADNGFDVWLGNSRGNVYSNKHIHLTTKDDEYWDFSWDEMAKYDLPACVEYVLNVTEHQQLHYVGHSQGTTIGFAGFSQNKVLASKIRTFFALAPVATVQHIKGAIKFLSNFAPFMKKIIDLFGIRDFLPSNAILEFIAQEICGHSHSSEKACGNIVFLIAGFDTSNLNDTRLPVYLSHLPAGTSVKDFLHYLQMVKSGKFIMYDYGSTEKNQFNYHQSTPPLYNISSCEVPVAIYSGSQDWLADPEDIHNSILPFLPNILSTKNLDSWNHLDFVWGIEANRFVYTDVVKQMLERTDL